MPSNSNLAYALAAMTALVIGLGASFWRSAAENKSLVRANLTAGIALDAAQDEANVLRERLLRETKAREAAEAAQTAAGMPERAAREKLAQETKARDAAELRHEQAVETIAKLTVKLNQEVAALNEVQENLTGVAGQVSVLSARLAWEMEAREKAVTLRMQAVSPISGVEVAQAAAESKDEENGGTPARSEDVPKTMPVRLTTRKPKTRPAPGLAPLVRRMLFRGGT